MNSDAYTIRGGDQRRLVEYFLIVSPLARRRGDPPLEGEENSVSTGGGSYGSTAPPNKGAGGAVDEDEIYYHPAITARYPVTDHEDNPFQDSVTCFCHPTGAIEPRTEEGMPKIHFFVTTGGKGQQMYGTCLTLWEPYEKPIIKNKKGKQKKKQQQQPQQKPTLYDDLGEPVVEEEDDNDGGETSEDEEEEEVYYLPKVVCLLSAWPYLVAFREYLTQLYRLSKGGTMSMPIERYITNFCSEVPAPPPGSFEVQTTILDSVIKLWSPPHNQPIPWVSLPFSDLFQCLDLNNIMLVWHAIALERQVLLTSTQLSLLTTCGEILLSFLFPMRWSHTYVPVLPHFLIPMLSSPMPYLCGIDKRNLPEALFDLSAECIVVDLDKNYVTLGPMTPRLPALPMAHNQAVKAKLEESAGMVYKEARCLNRSHDTSERGQRLPNHVKAIADAAWESRLGLFDDAFHLYFTPEEARKNALNGDANYSQNWDKGDSNVPLHIKVMSKAERSKLKKQSDWDAVQECFLGIYLYMLRNYRKFLVFPSNKKEAADPSGGVSEDGPASGVNDDDDGATYSYGGAGFRTKPFLQSQRRDMQPFLRQLCATQQFDNFITKRLYGSGEADVTFFDSAINKIFGEVGNGSGRRRSDVANTSSKEPLLQSAGVRHKLKTIVPPEPCSADLPPPAPEMLQNVAAFYESEEGMLLSRGNQDYDDDVSVITTHSASSYSITSPKPSRHKQQHHSSNDDIYVYPKFPEELDEALFGTPRPLPSAVLAEFDRQREDAARFRRKAALTPSDGNAASSPVPTSLKGQMPGKENGGVVASSSPEVATFSLFFISFTALVGKELMEMTDNFNFEKDDRVILSSYTPTPRSNKKSGGERKTHDGSDSTTADVSEMSSLDDVRGDKTNQDAEEGKGGESLDDDNNSSDLADSNGNGKNVTQLDEAADDIDRILTYAERDAESSLAGEESRADDELESIADDVSAPHDGQATSQEHEEGGLSDVEDEKEAEQTDHETNPNAETERSKVQSTDDNEQSKESTLAGEERENKVDSKSVEKDSSEAGETLNDEADAEAKQNGEEEEEQTDATSTDGEAVSDKYIDDVDKLREENDTKELFPEEDKTDEESIDESDVETPQDDRKPADTETHKNEERDGEDNTIEASSGALDISSQLHSPVRRVLSAGNLNTSPEGAYSTSPVPTSPVHPRAQSMPVKTKRNRFRDKLSVLEVEEAKATARAQLGVAFDILQMMRERSLKADPAAYQCLIEACGRCGDTERAKQLLSRMHQDGIVADGVVYSCLVAAFSSNNAWKKSVGKSDEDLPEWANGASLEVDWNTLRSRSYMDVAKQRLSSLSSRGSAGAAAEADQPLPENVPAWRKKLSNFRRRSQQNNNSNSASASKRPLAKKESRYKKNEMVVTEPVMMHILLGENLLELIYPDVSIDMEEYCPRCNKFLSDGDIVAGWTWSDSQNYTTSCPSCTQKFVPHFSIQSTSPSFVGSKGPSSPLFCERLSPWVLQKELRTVMGDKTGIEEFLRPEWREKEARNATLWWNLVVSFMRYRLPISFLLQGNFESSLITPTPSTDES